MTYQQARRVAVIKRIIGWIVSLPALLSTVISLLIFASQQVGEASKGVGAVLVDLMQLMIGVTRFNTPFFDLFWRASPVPDFSAGFTPYNALFFIIYFLIFVGIALSATGARIARQVKHIREALEDKMILDQLKGDEGHTLQQLENNIDMPHHTILRQHMILVVWPVGFIVLGYILFKILGWL